MPSRDRGTPAGAMKLDVDIRHLLGCTCFSLRRAARQVTQIYDHRLAPAGLTANQFTLMVQLYGFAAAGRPGLSIGALAERVGMDPTTLTRNLQPLEAQGLVGRAAAPEDGRVRTITITDKGFRRLQKAVPLWQQAQTHIEEALGAQNMLALKGFLDLSFERLSA